MPSAQAQIPDPEQQRLLALYLENRRLRFKSEINRLSGGGMQRLLGQHHEAEDLSFLLTYVYAWYWLRQNVAAECFDALLAPFKGSARAFLMDLLETANSGEAFVRSYVEHWLLTSGPGPAQREQLLRLLKARANDKERLVADVMHIWRNLALLTLPDSKVYAQIARTERKRYSEILGETDKQRLALVDSLPDISPANKLFDKLGLIPHMGCPQTCRHCMFIWRPFVRSEENPDKLYDLVDAHTRSVLFTGGDLTRHMAHFYRAIEKMGHVRTFAILLNGDFAADTGHTKALLDAMQQALRSRPAGWSKARILLQISFDEFHQEVIIDKHGRLKERIPVEKIANIVELAPEYTEIQIALLHKQNHLNFSMDLFRKGVFGRLAMALGRRGHRIQVLSTAPSARAKVNPLTGQRGQLVKDASFVLDRYPDNPILLTSSTIDAYGRAELLEEGESVKEKAFLADVLGRQRSPGQGFDTDLMFWFNGWATLFSAVHVCLGNVYEDGAETILARQRKDPLSRALADFDRRLLDFYAEQKDDLQRLIDRATGPHHLFHQLTEDAGMRLHMTRRLLG
ncbi:MAG TPA: radical SAM protein [Chromatiaceae bacterium]|nr:radical SAM protein [Chromatiaceae bacterium]